MDVPLHPRRRARPARAGGPAGHAPAALRAAHLRGAALPRGSRPSGAPAWTRCSRAAARRSSPARLAAGAAAAGRQASRSRAGWSPPGARARDPARAGRVPARPIEARTGRPVVHLCYPWHVSGPTARRLAREAGYRTAFWGKVPGTPLTLPGGDPQAIARIGEDYVELLPGRGRLPLSDGPAAEVAAAPPRPGVVSSHGNQWRSKGMRLRCSRSGRRTSSCRCCRCGTSACSPRRR